jgi:hypothetical protein
MLFHPTISLPVQYVPSVYQKRAATDMQYPAGLKKARKRKNKNGTDPDDLLEEETADIPEYPESEASDKDESHEAEVTATSAVRPQKRTYRIKGRDMFVRRM